MPSSSNIVTLDAANPVEGLLSFYRARAAHVADAHEHMAEDFAATLAELQEAREALVRAEARVPGLTSYGYVRGGIAGRAGSRPRKEQVEALLP